MIHQSGLRQQALKTKYPGPAPAPLNGTAGFLAKDLDSRLHGGESRQQPSCHQGSAGVTCFES